MSHPDQNSENLREPDAPKRQGTVMVATGLFAGLLVIALLLVLHSRQPPSPTAAPQTLNAAAPSAVPLKTLPGDGIREWIISKMKASNAKIGVVNIWATWCVPCRDEMPELAKFQKTGLAPLFLISADNEVDESIVRSFLHDTGVDFESALIQGDQQAFVEQWQKLSSPDPAKQWSMSLPATFLVKANGDVVSFSIGTNTASGLEKRVKNSLDTMRD